jgi:16S rRNA (cytosine1402-N4)-methyltransferase
LESDVPRHEPVLLEEALEILAVSAGGFYVDGTVGLGGHSEELLRRSAPDGRLLAVDRDSETLALAEERLRGSGERARFVQAEFREIPRLLGDDQADGILLDLGVSSAQLEDPDRGFSFQTDGPLDMRMDRSHGETAADVVNRLGEPELADVIYRFGEEKASRRIARAIAAARRSSRIRTTGELAEIVRRAAPHGRPGLHPATRTFQAIRIRVNRELEGLGATVAALARALKPGGRLAVIAFHSLEDREVKQAFRQLEPEGFLRLTKKPLRPTEAEVRRNPRARSARLRGLRREAAA